MLKLWLIRHGKTEGNKLARYIGTTDEPLCQEGIDFLGKMDYPKVQNIYISPLKRCVQTAEILFPGELVHIIDELAECVSSGVTTEDISDNNTLRHALNDFLFCLEPEKRIIFMQRYWYMMPIKAIAAEHSSTESRIKMILLRTRSELKEHLIKEGITL